MLVNKRIISMLTALCICLCAVILPSSDGIAQNNDAKYDSYVNMLPNTDGHAKYIVPNLYRQDASYINVKTFPLVVNGGVEYFPLDIFALYPYLQVVYSKIAHGFYINNTKNNHYVAFDMETGTTTTHDAQHLDIQGKIFNRTYYVPAAKVCEILEMKFETYDDPASGIRAARISDSKAKMTLPQLITAYSPVKKEPETEPKPEEPSPVVPDNNDEQKPDVTIPDNTDTPEKLPDNNPVIKPPTFTEPDEQDNITKPDEKPDEPPVDPYTLVENRYIHLLIDAVGSDSADAVLDALAQNGINAAFFVDEEFIMANPATVRRMITDGHFIGIHFNAINDDGSVMAHEDLLSIVNSTNDALYLVTKTKTRYIYAGYGYGNMLRDNGFAGFASENGYVICASTFDSGAADYYSHTQLDALVSRIIGDRPGAERRVIVRFALRNGSPMLIDALVGFMEKYPQFMTVPVDEYTFIA